MNDLDKAELLNWIQFHREDWQRVQAYIDMRITETRDDSLNYITQLDRDGLCEVKGKLEAFKEVRNLSDTLS